MDSNSSQKLKNNISWGLVLFVIIYMMVTQSFNNMVQSELNNSELNQIKSIYDLDDIYKSQGDIVIKKYVIQPSYDGLSVNNYYKDSSGYVYTDFSDLRLNKRYLMKIVSRNTKDSRATYNMTNSLLLHTEESLKLIENYESIKEYTSFYINEYNIKDVEGLEELDNVRISALDELFDKEYTEVEIEENTESEVTVNE